MHRDVRQTYRAFSLIAGAVLTALLAVMLMALRGTAQGGPGPIRTDPDLKVAFIGDSGNGLDFKRVLELIKSEGADMVMHQGDFDYANDADGFFATIDGVLGPNFPYFASVGNHDIDTWNEGCADPRGCYAEFLKNRMARIGVTPDDPNLNDEMYSVTYRGLKMVFVGQDGPSAGDGIYAPYLQDQLVADDHIWRICSWHKNQHAMQVGRKDDEMGWRVYETCKDLGAIIATGHEHSYHRTKTLTSIQTQIVDASCSGPDNLCVAKGSPGKSFVFVSGLGGRGVRGQERCLPATVPYGCNGEWARIYTRTQGATFGALFITFNVDGDPRKARGYFKNINGEIIDTFEISADAAGKEAKRKDKERKAKNTGRRSKEKLKES
jgi:calcineurin-like phosphoesterase family protein